LHHQIKNGGAEAMFYDLRKLDLEGWHPREIPKGLLTNPALQKQQSHNLPPYLTLLHNGKLPGALKARPNTAYTRSLMDDAIERVPRLRWELSDVGLRNFLTDEARIGVICIKYRTAFANGWAFPPLPEYREAWSRRYGPTKWDTDIVDWGEPVQEEAKPNVAAVAPARPANTNVPAQPVAAKPAGWRRF